MMLTKIVSRLVPQDFKPGTEREGRYYCATTSHGHNSEKTKLSDEPQKEGLKCLLCEAKEKCDRTRGRVKSIQINPKMELANTLANHSDLTKTKFGRSPVGSFSSYQLSHTE